MYITGDPEGIPYSIFTEKLPHSRDSRDNHSSISFCRYKKIPKFSPCVRSLIAIAMHNFSTISSAITFIDIIQFFLTLIILPYPLFQISRYLRLSVKPTTPLSRRCIYDEESVLKVTINTDVFNLLALPYRLRYYKNSGINERF